MSAAIEWVAPREDMLELTLECVRALKDYEPAKEDILKTLKFLNSPILFVDKRSGIDARKIQTKPGSTLVVEGVKPNDPIPDALTRAVDDLEASQ